jgi:hypothetical protein
VTIAPKQLLKAQKERSQVALNLLEAVVVVRATMVSLGMPSLPVEEDMISIYVSFFHVAARKIQGFSEWTKSCLREGLRSTTQRIAKLILPRVALLAPEFL